MYRWERGLTARSSLQLPGGVNVRIRRPTRWGASLFLALAAVSLGGPGRVAAATGYSPVVPPVYGPTISTLSRASIPVYLPTWLPSLPVKVYPFTAIAARPDPSKPQGLLGTYEADLSLNARGACDTCDLISIRGSNQIPRYVGYQRRMTLAPKVYAYVYRYARRQWYAWRIGPDAYWLSCSRPVISTHGLEPCSSKLTIRIIRSVVRIT